MKISVAFLDQEPIKLTNTGELNKSGLPMFVTDFDYKYLVTIDDGKHRDSGIIFIPKTFRTDGASIPKPLQGIMGDPLEPDFLIAMLIHDWIYTTRMFADKDIADQIFYGLLKKAGVGSIKAWMMYKAVSSWFGRDAWDEIDPDLKAERKKLPAMFDPWNGYNAFIDFIDLGDYGV